jgi:uncharacterized damage-inducible protein DinB
MITPSYAQTMAHYNTWQNANIYGAAAALRDEDRKSHRGVFFGSIHATLNHLMWTDQMWLMRFKAHEPPRAKSMAEGLEQYGTWDELRAERLTLDTHIEAWAARLTQAELGETLHWHSAGAQRDMVTPMAVAITHFFNHQTHHRGQVHGVLTGFGVKPGITDLPFLGV